MRESQNSEARRSCCGTRPVPPGQILSHIIEWFKANDYKFGVLQADSFGYHCWPIDVG